MRSALRRGPRIIAILGTCAAMVAAGCSAARTASEPRTTAPPPARERAVSDAAAILTAFVVPPGARSLQQVPDALKTPVPTFIAGPLVDDVSFWSAPGQPSTVLAWEQAHLPSRFTPGQVTVGPPSWGRAFSLAPVPGVLNNRDLVVGVAYAGHDQTVIRVDAQVTWQLPRPAQERVPDTARVVTISQWQSSLPHARPPAAPVTITDVAVVRRLAALVNSLPLQFITGPVPLCPNLGGIQLTFLATAGGPSLAVAEASLCGGVQFSLGGNPMDPLELTESFIPQVLELAGLHWDVQQ